VQINRSGPENCHCTDICKAIRKNNDDHVKAALQTADEEYQKLVTENSRKCSIH